jgi:hypothetical protein
MLLKSLGAYLGFQIIVAPKHQPKRFSLISGARSLTIPLIDNGLRNYGRTEIKKCG